MQTFAEFAVGTVWQINDTRNIFRVVGHEQQYVVVENISGPKRRRRILSKSLVSSKAKTGYTELDARLYPQVRGGDEGEAST